MLLEDYDVYNCEISICTNSMGALDLHAKFALRIFIVLFQVGVCLFLLAILVNQGLYVLIKHYSIYMNFSFC